MVDDPLTPPARRRRRSNLVPAAAAGAGLIALAVFAPAPIWLRLAFLTGAVIAALACLHIVAVSMIRSLREDDIPDPGTDHQ
jgi:hypothetical protein